MLSGFFWTKVITLSSFYCVIYFLGSSRSSLFFSTFTIFSISSSLSLLSLSLISLFSSIPISLHSLSFLFFLFFPSHYSIYVKKNSGHIKRLLLYTLFSGFFYLFSLSLFLFISLLSISLFLFFLFRSFVLDLK